MIRALWWTFLPITSLTAATDVSDVLGLRAAP